MNKSLRDTFKQRVGYEPDLDYPRSFNEKVTWKKLNDRNPLLVETADKFACRNYIAERVGAEHLIPLVGVYESYKDIPVEHLENCIIKATHASGWNVKVDKDTNKHGLASKVGRWLNNRYYGETVNAEWAYSQIKPRVVVEELIDDTPRDFKFIMIHGKCEAIQTEIHSNGKKYLRLYSADFEPLDVKRKNWRHIKFEEDEIIEKPENFDRMVQIAEMLSKDFDFVRVDLYNIDGKIYCGELTHYPGSGMGGFEPESFDYDLGSKWKIPGNFNILPGKKYTILTWLWRKEHSRFVYTAQHVNRAYKQLKENLTIPFEFACVTNIPQGIESDVRIIPLPTEFDGIQVCDWNTPRRGLPQCYRRLKMYDPKAAEYFGADRWASIDLDFTAWRNADDIFTREEDFIIARGQAKNRPYNGSLQIITAGARPQVYEKFNVEEVRRANEMGFIGSDQAWIIFCLGYLEKTLGEEDGIYLVEPSKGDFWQPPDECKITFWVGPGGRFKPINEGVEITEEEKQRDKQMLRQFQGAYKVWVRARVEFIESGRKHVGQEFKLPYNRARQLGNYVQIIGEVK